MSFFFYTIGIAAAFIVFLYFISLFHKSEKKSIKKPSSKEEQSPNFTYIQPKLPIFSIPPGERMCPLCRTKLTKHEALYASRVRVEDTAKIFIYGCKYCYKEDKKAT